MPSPGGRASAGGAVTDEVPAAAGDVGAGSQIASYRLGEQIGWGGQGGVFRARGRPASSGGGAQCGWGGGAGVSRAPAVGLDGGVALKTRPPEIPRAPAVEPDVER